MLFSLLLTILNARALDNPFLHDDLYSIKDNENIRTLKNIPRFFVDPTLFSSAPYAGMYRPIVLVSLAFNYAISGESPWSYRLFNIVIHGLNAVLLMVLLRKWKRTTKLHLLIAGAIFLLSPLACYPIFLVSARSALLYGTFLILTLLCYESALDKISGMGFWPFLVVSLIAFSLGLLSNAVSVMISVFIWMRSIAWLKLNRPPISQSWKIAVALFSFAICTIAYLLLHKTLVGTTFGENYVRPLTVNALLQVKLLYVYFKMFLYPFDYPLYYPIVKPFLSEPPVLAALLTTLLWVVVGVKRLFSARWLNGFLLLMPLVAYFPYGAIPLNVPLAEHHFYVPVMGVVAFLVIKFHDILEKRKLTMSACFFVICAMYSLVIVHRGNSWSSEFALSGSAVKLSPTSTLAWDDLGVSYMNASRYNKAIWAYRQSLLWEPRNMGALYNLGITYFYMERYDEAVKTLMKCREMSFRHRPVYYEDGIIGMGLARQGKFSEALPFLDSAISNGVKRSDVYIDKIKVLVQLHRADEVLPLCKEMKRLDAKNSDGMLWCARAEYASGNLRDAGEYMEELFSMGVYNPDTVFLGASILRGGGKGDQAMRMLESAIAKWSDSGKLWLMKGMLLEDLKMTEEASYAYKKALELKLPPDVEAEVRARLSKMRKQGKGKRNNP